MKKFMFTALAYLAFAFSGFASNEEVNEITLKNNTIQSDDFLNSDRVDSIKKAEDCLLKVTIVLEDGSKIVQYIMVTGASCEEILGPSKTKTLTPSK